MHTQRVAIIGYGTAGRCYHGPLVRDAPGLELRGFCSRHAGRRRVIREEQACIAYESPEEVLSDDNVDLVILATPHATHADLAVNALEAGKHVVTDKVMCLSLQECDRMIRTSIATERFLSVFHNRRWDGDFLTLQDCMKNHRLGRVTWVEMAWQKYGPPKNWRGQAAAGGGRFYDLGPHLLDQILLLFPQRIEGVYCRMHHDFPDTDVESHCVIVLMFADGCTGVCDVTSMAMIPKPRFHVFGSEATFIKYGIDPQEDALKAGDLDSAVEKEEDYARIACPAGSAVVPTIPGRWRNFYENVAAVLNRGAEPLVKLREMRRLMAVLDAAKQSAARGGVITPERGER